EHDLASLVIAQIPDFQGHLAGQFALDYEVPFLHHRIPKTGLDAAERNRHRQGKHIGRIAAGQPVGKEIAAGTFGATYANETADAARPRQLHAGIEGPPLTAIRTASLILFAAEEDAEAGANDCLRVDSVRNANARAEIPFIPGNQRTGHLASRDFDGREGG